MFSIQKLKSLKKVLKLLFSDQEKLRLTLSEYKKQRYLFSNYKEYWANNSLELHNRVSRVKEMLQLGTPTGIKFLRLGSMHDGGYVIADDITPDDYIISFGIADNVDFEKDLSEFGCAIDMYDYSVDGLPINVPNSRFFKEKIGIEENCTPLKTCLNKTDKDVLLKIDIEGSEYDLFSTATEEELERCRQITIEFHWLQNLVYENFYNKALLSFNNLRKTHTPVLIHPNNNSPFIVLGNSPVPVVFEILYLRNSTYKFEEEEDLFRGLLKRNNVNYPEIGLTFP